MKAIVCKRGVTVCVCLRDGRKFFSMGGGGVTSNLKQRRGIDHDQ